MVIRRFSEVLKQKAPGDAIMARLGGEEFAFMLPSIASTSACQLAEELRTAFKQIAFDTVAGEDEGLTSLIERADHALYKAKSSGRDCVHIAE
ncbi:GGDEF domain-containing protein [Brucella intermedia]|uniref:GGDEF domain-containing protein n=1 Tax=Brucella intermedia TaxID=94625 RepID=UPI002494EFB7|nr:GGDEF domain-containing protein [Brucella intermedia]